MERKKKKQKVSAKFEDAFGSGARIGDRTKKPRREPPPAEEIREGSAVFRPSAHVFFNPLQTLQRDLTVAALGAALAGRTGATVLDAMCGGGVRGVRYALEVAEVGAVVATDTSEAAVAAANATAAANGLGAAYAAVVGDANARMRRDSFDAVDLDPCGSAAPFVDAGVRSVRSGGLLCVASTEDVVGSGPRDRGGDGRSACFARYGGFAFSEKAGRALGKGAAGEVALRLLAGRVCRAARDAGRTATPLLCVNVDFFRRCYFRVDDGASEVPHAVGDADGARVAWTVGDRAPDARGGTRCGPLYAGALYDGAFAAAVAARLDPARSTTRRAAALLRDARDRGDALADGVRQVDLSICLLSLPESDGRCVLAALLPLLPLQADFARQLLLLLHKLLVGTEVCARRLATRSTRP